MSNNPFGLTDDEWEDILSILGPNMMDLANGQDFQVFWVVEEGVTASRVSDSDSPLSAYQYYECHPCTHYRLGVCTWPMKDDTIPACF